RDLDGRGRPFRVERRIELEEPGLAFAIPRGEARVSARRLFPDHHPLRRIGWWADNRTARELFGRDRARADPVREPARIRHLVNGVDVLGPLARGLRAGNDE